jgi:hypothetical protein
MIQKDEEIVVESEVVELSPELLDMVGGASIIVSWL